MGEKKPPMPNQPLALPRRDILVQNAIARLREFGGGEVVTLEGREENIVSEVPKELRGCS